MSFEKASEYAHKFEPFREFYQANDSLDIDSLEKEEHGTLHTCSAVCDAFWRGCIQWQCVYNAM